MRFRKLIKIPLINLAVLGIIGGSSMIAHANTNHVHTSVVSNINQNNVYKISAMHQGQSVRPQFITSNSKQRLNRSGFSTENDRSTHPFIYIYNNYAPNSRRAVVSKRIRFNKKWYWITANCKLASKYPKATNIYHYISKHSWKLISIGSYQFTKRRVIKRNYIKYKKHLYRQKNYYHKRFSRNDSNSKGLSKGLKYSNNDFDIIPKNNYWAKKFINEMKVQTLKNINNEREANGVAPLQESTNLDTIANMRAKQLHAHYGHMDSNGKEYAAEDGNKLGFNGPYHEYGENCGEDSLSDILSHDTQDGKGMANFINDEMMNHDASSNWGHRKNILDPSYKVIGVGADYQPGNTFPFTLSEDFDYTNVTKNASNEYDGSLGAPSIYNKKFILHNQPKGSYVTYGPKGYATVHIPNSTPIYYYPETH